MIPADLLDQLREKDPMLWIRVHANDFIGDVFTAWLQYCLQEAIRARGWKYQILAGKHKPHVFIDTYDREAIIDCLSDTEAEALLISYLAAIQEAA
ncbi:MAG: hypothetical protein GX465_19530 [Acidobacteria bacterium]|nr:hypothetical protein [Acidobacteriota bacterium]